MKRCKQLLSLVLALMLTVTVLTMPAAAKAPAADDVLGYVGQCPECGGSISNTTKTETYYFETSVDSSSCKYTRELGKPMAHPHRFAQVTTFYACDSCSYRRVLSTTMQSEYCLYANLYV